MKNNEYLDEENKYKADEFYYFKYKSYIIRVYYTFVLNKQSCWARGISASAKFDYLDFWYPFYAPWEKATRKDWYKEVRKLNEKR